MPSGTVAAVIPARYASTRLPGKALLKETGKYLIQHVYERVRLCKGLDRVLIATDDERVLAAAKSFGAEALLTSTAHPSGTDRCAEAVRDIPCDRVINVQGDEPEVDPAHIEALIGLLDAADMATLATPFADPADAALSGRVKVVLDRAGHALYFSRSRIPHSNGHPTPALLHVGMYGYSKQFLLRYVKLEPTALEKAERLEQLRALEHGFKIRVGVVFGASTGGVDTPEDYARFVRRMKERGK